MFTTINETHHGFHAQRTPGGYDYEVVREWDNVTEWATGTDGSALRFYRWTDAERFARNLNGGL